MAEQPDLFLGLRKGSSNWLEYMDYFQNKEKFNYFDSLFRVASTSPKVSIIFPFPYLI